MASIFGEEVRSIKFFNFELFNFEGTEQVIARAGYSKQGGFEIYFKGYELGEKLWDTIWKAGKEFDISPGCPNLIERIEGGLMSYGNDFTRENNPLECNLEMYCTEDNQHDFIGKAALNKIRKEVLNKKLEELFLMVTPVLLVQNHFLFFQKIKKRLDRLLLEFIHQD